MPKILNRPTALHTTRPPRRTDPKHQLDDFETSEDARMRREEIADFLAKGDRADKALARKLESCDREQPCGSPGCHSCNRQVRRIWTSMIAKATEVCITVHISWTHGKAIKPIFVTVVPYWARQSAGELSNFDMREAADRIRQALKRSVLAGAVIFGAWDFSYNEGANSDWMPHWQPHLGLIILTTVESSLITETLRDIFSADEICPRPVLAKKIKDGDVLRVAAYLLKSGFYHRLSLIDKTGRRRIKNISFKPKQICELTTYLDQHALTERWFLRNARRRGTKIDITAKVERSRYL